jgi:hypothetical protein
MRPRKRTRTDTNGKELFTKSIMLRRAKTRLALAAASGIMLI